MTLPTVTDNRARTCCAWPAASPIWCRRRSTDRAGRTGCSSSSRGPGSAPRSPSTTSSTPAPMPTPPPGCGRKAGGGSGCVSRLRLLRQVAAVDREDDAGDERGVGGGEEEDGGRDLARIADATHRVHALDRRQVLDA